MANFQNNAITDSGRVLLSHVQMGAVFTPTKIVIGSGSVPAGKTAKTMSEVAAPVKELAINKKQRTNDGKVIIGGMYSNQDIEADWYFRELALFAKAVYADGTEADEVLYSYGNAGDTADLMPAYSSGQPVERQMDLVVYVGSDAEVDLTIAPGMSVTVEMLDEQLSGLAPSSHTHSADDINGGILSISRGGTGAGDAASARDRLGITPQAIGAVSNRGGTISGNIIVEDASISSRHTGAGRQARIVSYNNNSKEADFQNFGSDTNYVSLRVATESQAIGDAVKVAQMRDGSFSSFPVLHTGNKEKIFTYGTEDLTAGVSTLESGKLHFVYE